MKKKNRCDVAHAEDHRKLVAKNFLEISKNAFYLLWISYIHFPLTGQWMVFSAGFGKLCNSSTAVGKVGQSNIARMLGLHYFLLFLKVEQLRQNARYIYQ